MKKIYNVLWLALAFFVFAPSTSKATHIMGGNLQYEYLGANIATGNYDYRVTITMYRYCASGSSLLPTSLDIGVYQDNVSNPTGDKLLVIDGVLPLISQQPITPPNGNDSCTFAPNVCVEQGVYQAVLSVPANTTGYYFISDRCCRNNNIINLNNPGNMGQAYYAYAPPPTIVNSSPNFAVVPVPFICSSDTASILNLALDPDGDLLSYQFVTPYQGISSNANPTPNPPNTYNWPIPTVNYAPTYSVGLPFGPGGSATIDTSTGLASYYSPNQGFYVLAVEVSEWRNGVLVGVTRLDLQIIVIACPVNPAPTLSGSNQVNYIINEGQTLCFNSTFSDSNGDSLFMTHTGDIFDPLVTNPPATFIDASGNGTVTGQFCWTPSCDQGRPTPYQFSVIVTDDGCPAKITNVVYSITVVNTAAPTSMTGPDTLCFNAANNVIYTVPNVLGNTHGWSVGNGTITGSSTGTTVHVNFTAPGNATVSAVVVNPNGCVSDTLTKDVYIAPVPAAVAGPDVAFCSGASAALGTGATPGVTYSWSPATGLSSTSVSDPIVTLSNPGTSLLTVNYVLTTTEGGCSNSDTVTVTVYPPVTAAAGPDVAVCEGNSVTIGNPAVPGNTYSWSPATGLSSTSAADPTVTLPTAPDTVTYILTVQNSFGCGGNDTVVVTVNPAPNANAGTNKVFCSGNTVTIGGNPVAGYSYSWSPVTGLSNSSQSNPQLTLNNVSGQNDTLYYIVTVTLGPCTDTDTVRVVVRPLPVSNAGPDQLLCAGDSVQIGSGSTQGYLYSWSPATGLTATNISNPVVILNNTGTSPDTLSYIVTTTLNGCVTTDTVTIISSPVPVADAGPDVQFCSGTPASIGTAATPGYSYSWTPSAGLSSNTSSNPSITLTNTSLVNDTVNFIVTTSNFGCSAGDTVQVIVLPSPVSNAGPNQQLICAGGGVQLGTANTPGYTYSWTPGTGLSSTSVSDPTLTLNNTGSSPDTILYIVTTTYGTCVTSDTVQVISSPVSVANAGPDVSFCSGSSATLGTAVSPNYTYSWSPATGLSSATAADPVLTLTNVSGQNDTLLYIVTTDLFGCTDSDTVLVIVRPNPLSNAGPDQLICAGNTVQLGTTLTTGYNYSWSPATGLSSVSVSDPTLTLNNTGTTPDTLTYIVTTTLNGCVTSDTVQVISSPVPVADAGTDVTICSGQSATIGTTNTGGYTYTWSPATGLSSGSVSDPTVTLTNSTQVIDTVTYIVTTGVFGCFDSDTVVVFVKPLPVSQAGPDITLCGGDTATIGSIAVIGYTYSWTPSAGLSDSTISNPQVVIANQSGTPVQITYQVTTTLDGCTTTDLVDVTINPQPVVTATTSPLAICLGSSATLTGAGATTYNWANAAAPGVSIGTTNPLVVSPIVTTTYILTGANGFACENSDSVTVIVNPIPVVQISAANDTICNGDTLTLTGTGASTYNWSVLGGGSLGSGTSIQVSPSSNTTYVVNGTDANGCASGDTISITVNPAATVNGIYGTASVCPGVTGVYYWVTNPNPASTYIWTVNNGTVVTGQGNDTITVDWSAVSGPASVSVVEVTDLGCQSDPVVFPVNINVFLTPVAPTGPLTFCANAAQGTYTALSTPGSTYNWFAQGGVIVSGNGTNTVTVNWTAQGPTTVQLWYEETSQTSVDTCFGTSDTLTVNINPAPITSAITGPASICVDNNGSFSVVNTSTSTYQWFINGGTILSGNGSNAITASWTGSGTATVSVVETNSLGCLGDTVDYIITVNALPAANAGPDVSVCAGLGVQLNASGGVTYSWSPSTGLSNPSVPDPIAAPAAATTYIVLVTDANGCQNRDTVLVSVNNLPVVTVSANTSICIGGSTQLTAAGGNSYSWSPAGSLSNASVPDPVASPTATTTYTVVVTNGIGCSDSSQVTVTVNPLPVAQASADTVICEGTSAYLAASGGVSYSWSPATGLNTTNGASVVATPQNPITYTVVVTDVNGCTDDEQVDISLNINPEAIFTVGDDVSGISCDGYTATLSNLSVNATGYEWTFADGSTSTDENPQHQFVFDGSNQVILVAINNMCRDTAIQDITHTSVTAILANTPEVFSPNGDGKNDCFELNVEFDDCSNWSVFNRWGNKVFSSSPSQPCWNGKKDNNGEELPTGTYYVVIKVFDGSYNGTVTLIR